MTLSSTSAVSFAPPYWIIQLPEDIRRAVLQCSRVQSVLAGESIYEQGAAADALYGIVSGAVQLVRFGAPTAIGVGECFGESEVINGTRYEASAVAASNAELWVLEKDALDALLKTHGRLGLALAQHLAQKIEQPIGSRPAAPPALGRRPAHYRISPGAVASLLVVLMVGIGLSAAGVWFWKTTRSVEGLQVSAPPTVSRRVASPAPPTRVAQVVKVAEPTPTREVATATHIVDTGDTLSAIARMHATNPATVRTLNGLVSDLIRVGDPLKVPGGSVVIVPTRTLRPQATATLRPTTVALSVPPTPLPSTLAAQAGPSAPSATPTTPPQPTPLPVIWKMPPWTSVEATNVPAGQTYWRLTQAIYFDEGNAGGRINIFVAALDEGGKSLVDIPVKMAWGAGESTIRPTESKRDPFLLPYDLDVVAAHDMAAGSSFSPDRGERGGYSISVEGLPSEVVSGMGLPLRRHVAFLLVYQRATK